MKPSYTYFFPCIGILYVLALDDDGEGEQNKNKSWLSWSSQDYDGNWYGSLWSSSGSDGKGSEDEGDSISSSVFSKWFGKGNGDGDGYGGDVEGKRESVKGVITLVLTIVGIICLALGLRSLLHNREEEGKEEDINKYGEMSDTPKSEQTEDENEQELETEEEEEKPVSLTPPKEKKVRKWRQTFGKFRSTSRTSKTTTSLKDEGFLPENV